MVDTERGHSPIQMVVLLLHTMLVNEQGYAARHDSRDITHFLEPINNGDEGDTKPLHCRYIVMNVGAGSSAARYTF